MPDSLPILTPEGEVITTPQGMEWGAAYQHRLPVVAALSPRALVTAVEYNADGSVARSVNISWDELRSNAAEAVVGQAQEYADAASDSATLAAASRQDAGSSATAAGQSATAAGTARGLAEGARDAAAGSAKTAQDAAAAAGTAGGTAGAAAAQPFAVAADASRAAAEVARGGAAQAATDAGARLTAAGTLLAAAGVPTTLQYRTPGANDDLSRGFRLADGVGWVCPYPIGAGYTKAAVAVAAPAAGGRAASVVPRIGTASAFYPGSISQGWVADPGAGYTVAPALTVTGDGTTASALRASLSLRSLWRTTVALYRAVKIDVREAVWEMLSRPPLPGDAVPGAIAVYGMKRLVAAYDGPLVDVVRESDGATLTIGIDPSTGAVDKAARDAFVGGSRLRVSRWYDQTGNGNHLTQALAAYRPVLPPSDSVDPDCAVCFDSIIYGGGVNGNTLQKFLDIPATVTAAGNAVSAFMVPTFPSSVRSSVLMGLSGADPLSFHALGPANSAYLTLVHKGADVRAWLRVASQKSIAGFTSGPTNRRVHLDDRQYVAPFVSSSAQLAGGWIGRNAFFGDPTTSPADAPAGAGYFSMHGIVLHPKELSPDEVQTMRESLTWHHGLTPQRRDTLIYDGDSITQGFIGTQPFQYDQYLRTRASITAARIQDLDLDVFNCGIGGATTADQLKRFDLNVAPLIRPGARNFVVFVSGINGIGVGESAADVYAQTTAYVAKARAAGATKVIVGVTLNSLAMTDSAKVQLKLLQDMIRANTAGADGIIDYLTSPRLAGPDRDVLDGNVHPNVIGMTLMSDMEEPAIRAAYAASGTADPKVVFGNLGTTLTGAATVPGTAASFTATIPSRRTLYAVLYTGGVDEGGRVSRSGSGTVRLTPAKEASYTARLYDAPIGGNLVAETAAFTVANPVTPPAETFYRVTSTGARRVTSNGSPRVTKVS